MPSASHFLCAKQKQNQNTKNYPERLRVPRWELVSCTNTGESQKHWWVANILETRSRSLESSLKLRYHSALKISRFGTIKLYYNLCPARLYYNLCPGIHPAKPTGANFVQDNSKTWAATLHDELSQPSVGFNFISIIVQNSNQLTLNSRMLLSVPFYVYLVFKRLSV